MVSLKTKSAIALGIVFVLFAAAFLMGCPQKQADTGGTGEAGGNATAPSIKSSDVPTYNDSTDSDIDNLAKELG